MTLLDVQEATKNFDGLTAVDTVSFEVEEGEILGVIGPNGAGKTTLFNLISGALSLDHGAIRFRDRVISGRPPHVIARHGVARTFQVVRPFGALSVLENVKIGAFLHSADPGEAERKARQVIELTGLSDVSEARSSELPLADRKRLELARALATEPSLLLLDEVMSGLTPVERSTMLETVQTIREQGVTLLVIEHVMAAIMSISDRIAVLHHGRLLAIGPPSRIARDPEVVEAYLGEEFQLAAT